MKLFYTDIMLFGEVDERDKDRNEDRDGNRDKDRDMTYDVRLREAITARGRLCPIACCAVLSGILCSSWDKT